ncbi:GNAT family N-acetyltransferase [Morganella morganii]|uniref:GNAT family N-acetyltransferase n=1 Tax=Morganella morganii TaxID=582 RepID=UPI003EB71283
MMKFRGWEKCSFSDYEACCEKFGYNAETSPHYIKFAMEQGVEPDFYAYTKKGVIEGAVCTDNGWLANDNNNPANRLKWMYFPRYSILLPFNKNIKCFLPFKTKSLSTKCRQFYNSSFSLFSRRHVAVSKDLSAFSSKTRATRKKEIRKFMADGGTFENVSTAGPDFLFETYFRLYADRRGHEVENDPVIRALFHHCYNNFFGEIAFLDGKAVGIQLLLSTPSKRGTFIDFLNIGYDMNLRKYSIGTMLMWRNLCLTAELPAPVTYSYGMMSGEYKARWCDPVSIGRSITF